MPFPLEEFPSPAAKSGNFRWPARTHVLQGGLVPLRFDGIRDTENTEGKTEGTERLVFIRKVVPQDEHNCFDC